MQTQDFLARYQRGERNFAHVDLSGASLSGVDLRFVDLTGANLTSANLTWAFLSGAKLTSACLRGADLRCATLNNANLNQAILSRANLSKVDLRLATLREADLNWALLQEADLSGADLQCSKLDQSNLEKANLNDTQLICTELMEANLCRATLVKANLTGANLREAHLEAANLTSCTLVQTYLSEANLSGVCLRNADLSEADLHRVILAGADLSEALLNRTDMSRANLQGAYLIKASLRKAHLLRANLQGAYMLRADLSEANLRGADLRQADLSGAWLGDTNLCEANLSAAYLLESHLLRTNLKGTQLTGCCIHNWHIEAVDLSEVECSYVFTQFNYTTKSPSGRYPVVGTLEPGKLADWYQKDSFIIEVHFQSVLNWEALVFALTQLKLDYDELTLDIKSYERIEGDYLLRLAANRSVDVNTIRDRVLQLYPQIQQRLSSQRTQILELLDIKSRLEHSELARAPDVVEPLQPPSTAATNKRLLLYQEVVRQIEYMIATQAPKQLVESVQRLLDYLKRQGFSTDELQRTIIVLALVQRAKQDKTFLDELLRRENTAAESVRLSAMEEAVRLCLASLWSQPDD